MRKNSNVMCEVGLCLFLIVLVVGLSVCGGGGGGSDVVSV